MTIISAALQSCHMRWRAAQSGFKHTWTILESHTIIISQWGKKNKHLFFCICFEVPFLKWWQQQIPQGTYHLIILIKYSTRGHTPADSHQKTQLTLQLNLQQEFLSPYGISLPISYVNNGFKRFRNQHLAVLLRSPRKNDCCVVLYTPSYIHKTFKVQALYKGLILKLLLVM